MAAAAKRRFDWVAGHACLDLTNTVNRPDDHPLREWLKSYDDLVVWAREGELVTPAVARRLAERALAEPAAAARVLARAIALREAVYRVFLAVAARRRAAAEDLDLLNSELVSARAHLRLVPAKAAFVEDWDDGDALDRPLWPVARSAAELLTAPDLDLHECLHQCAGQNCTYLFVDSTRNRRRRWCEMAVCGNLAKVRRHRQRLRAAAKEDGPAAVRR